MGVICNEENGSKCHHMHVIREFIILCIYFNMKLSFYCFICTTAHYPEYYQISGDT